MNVDKVVGVAAIRSNLRKIVEDTAKGSRYIITSRSQPRAVLMSIEEVEMLEIMADRALLEEIRQAQEDIKTGRYVSYERYFERP
ncbi:MAG: type II toxin-antitoxin system Phd/YefM family antitoxin [Armatimonadetes bacterium]|nr:type II toxin-antitoxin system Phd/YefM family antitoxin [Armatimonadota bacterium]